MVTDEALCKPGTGPDYRLLEYGNEIGVQSNVVNSTIDFF